MGMSRGESHSEMRSTRNTNSSVNKERLMKEKGVVIYRRKIKKTSNWQKKNHHEVQNYGSTLFTTGVLQKSSPHAVSSSILLKESLFLQ